MAVRRAANKLFVGNLPWTVSHNELAQYFSEFGAVSSARVVFNKETGFSKGFGFVIFKKAETVDTVISKPYHKLEGSIINCQRATESEL